MELKQIPLDKVDDHPDNPRVAMREDVIEAIAAAIAEAGYQQKHAIHVRPTGQRFQIISGHHRTRAANNAGLSEIWAWVEDMNDDRAYMELATSNNQGELDPLEIGIHAWRAVPAEKGGRGKKGGLSEYARAIGKDESNLRKYRDAGAVAEYFGSNTEVFLGRALHLAALHKLPEGCWPAACEWLARQSLSVADVQEAVKRACDENVVKLTEVRPDIFPELQVRIALLNNSMRMPQFQRLAALIETVASSLDEDLAQEWIGWLEMRAGNEAWDLEQVQAQRLLLEAEQWERNATPDAEQQVASVLLADPPWQYDAALPNRAVENQYPTATAEQIATHIDQPWFPKLASDCVLFMWTTAPKLREAFTVLDGWGFTYKTHAIWDKDRLGMGYWFRSKHELLLVATKGSPPTPAEGDRLPSIFVEKRSNKHSEKPECVYAMLESMFPEAIKAEVYQRKERKGWAGHGNESGK